MGRLIEPVVAKYIPEGSALNWYNANSRILGNLTRAGGRGTSEVQLGPMTSTELKQVHLSSVEEALIKTLTVSPLDWS